MLCVKLFDTTYEIQFVPRERLPDDHGECEDPMSSPYEVPKIRIREDLSEQDTLITLIHEMAHGCNWRHLSEEWVSDMAEHLGRALYQIGYRRDP